MLIFSLIQVQHALHKSDQALATLAKAVRLDANNPLCRFHRASILFATEKYQVGGREENCSVIFAYNNVTIRFKEDKIKREKKNCGEN